MTAGLLDPISAIRLYRAYIRQRDHMLAWLRQQAASTT